MLGRVWVEIAVRPLGTSPIISGSFADSVKRSLVGDTTQYSLEARYEASVGERQIVQSCRNAKVARNPFPMREQGVRSF